jgi:hypothetical protein
VTSSSPPRTQMHGQIRAPRVGEDYGEAQHPRGPHHRSDGANAGAPAVRATYVGREAEASTTLPRTGRCQLAPPTSVTVSVQPPTYFATAAALLAVEESLLTLLRGGGTPLSSARDTPRRRIWTNVNIPWTPRGRWCVHRTLKRPKERQIEL